MRSDLGWCAEPLVNVPDAAIDILRIAGGAYAADRLTSRGTAFTRSIELTVAVTDPDRWAGGIADDAADLLRWLTGDQWVLTLVADQRDARPDTLSAARDGRAVSLLSGGLDSFLGAMYLQHEQPGVEYLGHIDTAHAVPFHQQKIKGWLRRSYDPAPSYTRLHLTQRGAKAEGSSRSRSLMFVALGVALATSDNAGPATLYVPENGYTSLNIPLHVNRGGALSTRSTHPETFARLHRLFDRVGLPVEINNPFEWMTKGEAMEAVAALRPPDGWIEAAARTTSCSKLDGRTFDHGDPNLNCGYCLSCIVRRATFLRAGVEDRTEYLYQRLTGAARTKLIAKRRADIDAVRYAVEVGVDEDAIDAGTWPDHIDLDDVSALVGRGLRELAAVELP